MLNGLSIIKQFVKDFARFWANFLPFWAKTRHFGHSHPSDVDKMTRYVVNPHEFPAPFVNGPVYMETSDPFIEYRVYSMYSMGLRGATAPADVLKNTNFT